MKTFRVLLVLVLLCGFSSLSWADDFRINVLDPPPNPPGNPSLTYTDIMNTSPFDVVFGACPAFIAAVVSNPAFACFNAINDTGSTITSLTLTFLNSLDGTPGSLTALNGQPADCDTGGLGTVGPLFGGTGVCSLGSDSTSYLLEFVATPQVPGVPYTDPFYIVEQGADASAFGIGTGFVGLAADTPEPNSLLLLSTGAMMAGLLLFRRQSAYGQR